MTVDELDAELRKLHQKSELPDIRVHKIVTARMAQTGESYSTAFAGARQDPQHAEAFKAYGEMVWI